MFKDGLKVKIMLRNDGTSTVECGPVTIVSRRDRFSASATFPTESPNRYESIVADGASKEEAVSGLRDLLETRIRQAQEALEVLK